MKKLLVLILFLPCLVSNGQSPELIFPDGFQWNVVGEGDTLLFKLTTSDASFNTTYTYTIFGNHGLEISLDSAGNFFWVPSFELVDRVEISNDYPIIFEAASPDSDKKLREEIIFTVIHKNRQPLVGELPVFYVRQYSQNELNLKQFDQINDPDGDPIVFKPVLSKIPEGASISEMGVFTWRPSRTQFNNLRSEPFELQFIVQDQPEKFETIGKMIIAPTQQDLPPEITMVPNDTLFVIKEDEVININFYVSDPNGDDNIRDVSFVSNDLRVPKEVLNKNTATQWEFTWTPGYEFVGEEEHSNFVELVIYVLDETNKRAERKFVVEVEDTENLEQKDQRLYVKYRSILIRAMDLIAQLDENQKELNKQLKKATKGKKNRSIINASLGALTGVSPVFLEDQSKDYVTGIGGTAVLTLGTLEATEVMGRSKDDILEKLKINIDIRNQLQSEGDLFARKYAFKSQRRDENLDIDIDKLKAQLNNKKMILLELDAGWENPAKPTDKNIKKQFPDFNNEGFEEMVLSY